MKSKILAILLLLGLTGCSNNQTLQSLQEVPLPSGFSSVTDYDSEHNTSYETFAKQLFLNLLYLWDIPEGKTDVEFFVLPDSNKSEGEQYDFYQAELLGAGWKEDDGETLGFLRRWRYLGRRGTQTFITTYIRIPKSSDALAVRLLYPVYK